MGEPRAAGYPPLDIEEARERYLVQCGMHDYGLVEYGCNCPPDPRSVLMRALDELEEARKLVSSLRSESSTTSNVK